MWAGNEKNLAFLVNYCSLNQVQWSQSTGEPGALESAVASTFHVKLLLAEHARGFCWCRKTGMCLKNRLGAKAKLRSKPQSPQKHKRLSVVWFYTCGRNCRQMRCGEMFVWGHWPRVSAAATGADIRRCSSAHLSMASRLPAVVCLMSVASPSIYLGSIEVLFWASGM